MFDLGEHGGLLIDRYWDDPPERARLDETARLGALTAGQQFVYVFDLGDDWAHLCTVADQRIDPQDALGIRPNRPLPYWGWGSIPDQYGRRWDGDDVGVVDEQHLAIVRGIPSVALAHASERRRPRRALASA